MASASPSDAAAAAELQRLVQAIQDTHVSNICTAAAAAWLSYDILLTFRQEVSLVWSARWTTPKLLYFLVRYYTLVSLLLTVAVNSSHEVSFTLTTGAVRWRWYNGFNGTLTSAVFGEAMFLMRLYAAYQRSTAILIVIIILFLAEFVIGTVTAALVVSSFHVVPRPPNYPLPGCLFTPPKHVNLSLMVWAVAMGVTCVYFLLILYKFARNLSVRKNAGPSNVVPIWELQRISPVVFSFLRDSAFYFFLVFIGNTMNLVFELVFAGRAIIPMGTVWLMVIYALSASRLCLNTRGSLHRRRSEYELESGWHDIIELQDRSRSSGQRTNTNISAANITPGSTLIFAKSEGRVSLHRGAMDLDALEYTQRDYFRTWEYEVEPWTVLFPTY
ncbi:hypothetical protein K466DRAFT_597866 [Polyporus arcularius HHB13444]|uniref:DUF6533 domain-containing protein n=1 Tax=Polyporus arcularius HHB13444 TaxID=1314778 RepID=A0A5C3PK94_9APHY|nr:hypothetical protein K466DRAFT_597866 [Polyporus arcularius HHB13444]